jgi:hypothetical protein
MKISPFRLSSSLLILGSCFFACTSSPELNGQGGGDGDSGGDGDAGDGDGDSGDGDLNLGDGDSNSGDGDTGSGDGDGDSSNGDGDSSLGGAVIAPPWDYPDDVDFPYTPVLTGGDSCGSVEGTPESVSRPIDIIFIIDNSGSMSDQIQEVEENVKTNFADIIAASGIDYRVIMISRYGSSTGPDVGSSNYGVCVPTPLGGHDCVGPNGKMPVNGERFFHYSADIESLDGLCVLLESYDEPDEFDPDNNALNDGGIRNTWTPLAPTGWQEWLRPGAFKTFVMITDDDVDCRTQDLIPDDNDRQNFDITLDDNDNTGGGETAATSFDTALLSLSPEHFGTAETRNYVWHSILGLNENSPGTTAWEPEAAIQTSECGTGDQAAGYGTGYQALSRLTGGLRYPICAQGDPAETNFNPIFNEIALGVIETAAIPCEFDFPEVDGIINPANIKVRYTPSGGGDEIEFNRVTDEGACTTANDFYFDSNTTPTKLFLCGGACTLVQDDAGEITLDFGCLGN